MRPRSFCGGSKFRVGVFVTPQIPPPEKRCRVFRPPLKGEAGFLYVRPECHSVIPRRSNVALVLAVVYVDMLGVGLAFPLLPKLVQQFEGGSFSRASWIFGLLAAAYALMQFLLAPALGALSDRFGRRPVILISLFGMGINYLVLATAPSLAWLVAGRIVAGAMGASYSTAAA